MKVTDLDGNRGTLSLNGYRILGSDNRQRSSLHLKARGLISSLYTEYHLLEEVAVKVKRGKTLYLDFFIPQIKTVVEVHGEQHYKYSKHFHGSPQNFMQQRRNDAMKKEWCEVNCLDYIDLPYNEELEEWQNRLMV